MREVATRDLEHTACMFSYSIKTFLMHVKVTDSPMSWGADRIFIGLL